MDVFTLFVVTVMANVISNYISKWLDGKKLTFVSLE